MIFSLLLKFPNFPDCLSRMWKKLVAETHPSASHQKSRFPPKGVSLGASLSPLNATTAARACLPSLSRSGIS